MEILTWIQIIIYKDKTITDKQVYLNQQHTEGLVFFYLFKPIKMNAYALKNMNSTNKNTMY